MFISPMNMYPGAINQSCDEFDNDGLTVATICSLRYTVNDGLTVAAICSLRYTLSDGLTVVIICSFRSFVNNGLTIAIICSLRKFHYLTEGCGYWVHVVATFFFKLESRVATIKFVARICQIRIQGCDCLARCDNFSISS